MSKYRDIFDTRGKSYNQAEVICPRAREKERQLLIERLDLRGDELICDAPAGGGYLSNGIAALPQFQGKVICVEPSPSFAAAIDKRFQRVLCELDDLALDDEHVDRIGSLAGIHHLSDKRAFFSEAFRILRPGGRFVIADVRTDTPSATFLNDAVDRLTVTGHDGMFLRDGELTALLTQAGFDQADEQFCQYRWTFPSQDTLVTYCKALFGLEKADETQVLKEITGAFDIFEDKKGTHLPWSLIYATGIKPL